MSTKKLTKILSGFMAIIILLLALLPLSVSAATSTAEAPAIDYTPFMLEYNNGAVYNQQTAELSYNFYKEAKKFVDNKAKEEIKSVSDHTFNFAYNDTTYYLSSVYIHKPDWIPSCGLLVGILNYTFNGEEKHIMMVMFEGTKGLSDLLTDADITYEEADGRYYHNGFFETAERHYNTLSAKAFSLGDEEVTLPEYIEKMKEEGNNYQMLVTGHSLGAAVANIFTSYFIDGKSGNAAQKNAVAYTFATPLTCSDGTAAHSDVKNVFNFINKWDWVTEAGYGFGTLGGINNNGAREGVDLKFTAGSDNWWDRHSVLLGNHNDSLHLFNTDNHKMNATVYGSILDKANANIYKSSVNPQKSFVLYNKFDALTNTYQRIIYSNGTLSVSGSGVLAGNWSKNTFVNFAKISKNCTRLTFAPDCTITEIGSYAFSGMEQLGGDLSLPSTLTKIGDYAFFHCSALTGDLILKENMLRVGTNAFNGCSGLNSIDASNATNMTWGFGAFSNCVDRNKFKLPGGEYNPDIFGQYYLEDNFGYIALIDLVDLANDTDTRLDGSNYVAPGNKIHMGRLLDEDLNLRAHADFCYYLLDSDVNIEDAATSNAYLKEKAKSTIEGVAKVSSEGVITVDNACPQGKTFTVIILDRIGDEPDFGATARENNQKARAIRFTVQNESEYFEGGAGTQERPYRIKTYEQLKNISKDLSAHYKLIGDIDCTEETAWTSIATVASDPFTGSLDGNGYTIKGLTGTALFTYNAGTICNLTLESANIKKLSIDTFGGILAARNEIGGKIQNCHITGDSVVNITYKYNDGTCHLRIGGLVGANYGTIKNCSITGAKLTGEAKGGDKHYDVYCNVGGIAGQNLSGATISNCAAYDVTVKGLIYHNGIGGVLYEDNKSYAYFRLGGFVGMNQGAIETSSYCNAKPTYERTYYNHKGVTDSDYAIIKENLRSASVGSIQSGTVDCVEDAAKTLPTQSFALSIQTLPHKTTYYIGEELNLYGIAVTCNGENIHGYTVSGYDPNQARTQTLTVQYQMASEILKAEFTVTVENIIPKTVVILPQVDEYGNDRVFNINDPISLSDLRAIVYYNDGTREEVDNLADNDLGLIFRIVTDAALGIGVLNTTGLNVITATCNYVYKDENGISRNSETPLEAFVALSVVCDCTSTIIENAVAATNSEYGYTGDKKCTVCGEIVEEGTILTKIPCDNHTWNEGAVITPATHTTSGEVSFTCTVCDTTKTEVIPADVTAHTFGAWERHSYTQHKRACGCGEIEYVDHIWDEGIITAPATHTTEGEKLFTCTVCQTTKTEVIPADVTAHTFGAWERHSNTQHKRTCGCGEIEYADHTWDDGIITTPATHIATGVKTYTCTNCVATKTETVSPLGHVYNLQIATSKYLKQSATCTTTALYYYSCSCGERGESTFAYGSALHHSFTTYLYNNNATCEKDGTETAQCDRCSTMDTRTKVGSMLSHAWSTAWTTNQEGHYRTCNNCDAVTALEEHISGGAATATSPEICTTCGYMITPMLGHTHSLTYISAEEPSCTQAGNIPYYICSGCEKMYRDVSATEELSVVNIPALDHNYVETVTQPTCTEAGYTTHTCSRCTESYVDSHTSAKGHSPGSKATCTTAQLCTVCSYEIAGATGHSFTRYISDENATCEADGTLTATCDHCTATDTVIDTGSAIGHHYDQGIITQAPDCEVDGIKTFTCANDATHTYTESIPAKTHAYGAWVTVTEPTNLAVGKLTRVCVHNAAHIEEKELPILNGNDYACTAISAPTCEGTGTELYEIILDGQKFTYLVTLPATGHSFDTALQSDATHHFTVCACGVKKDSTAHIFAEIASEATKKSAPTCTDPAVYSKSCAICGYIGAESFVSGAANGHSFADGACTRCGVEDPNGVNPIVIPVAATGTVALGGAAVYLIIRKKKRI